MRMRWSTILACWFLYTVLAVALQWHSGALEGAWANNPDEPAHFINGVMVFDYVTSGFGQNPMRYAVRYYEHYPKVALGHWPPFLAAVEAGWFFLAPVSYRSALLLLALMAGVVSTLIAWVGSRWFPPWLAWCGGAVWLLLPVVRTHMDAFMAEVPLTGLATLAVLGFARASLSFGVWSALALMTKGTGIVLALLPPFAILMGKRWDWLRSKWLWGSAAIVLLVAAPWYLLVPGARHERVAEYGGLRVMHSRPAGTLLALLDFFGPVLCALAILGLAVGWRKLRKDPYWLAMVAFLPGHFVARATVAAWEARHLVMLTPEVLWLSMFGFQWVTERWNARWARTASGVALGAAILIGLWSGMPSRSNLHGVAELAAALPASGIVLVTGGSPVEGAVIGELALRDAHRPSRFVRRGSKLLATVDFLGGHYRSLITEPSDAAPILQRERIDSVVVDLDLPDQHTRLLYDYLRAHPELWVASGRFGDRMEMFRATPNRNDNPL